MESKAVLQFTTFVLSDSSNCVRIYEVSKTGRTKPITTYILIAEFNWHAKFAKVTQSLFFNLRE